MDWNLGVGGWFRKQKEPASFLHRGTYWDVQEGGKHVRVHACISIDLDRVRARVVPKNTGSKNKI
jgi:hypothetical protein